MKEVNASHEADINKLNDEIVKLTTENGNSLAEQDKCSLVLQQRSPHWMGRSVH